LGYGKKKSTDLWGVAEERRREAGCLSTNRGAQGKKDERTRAEQMRKSHLLKGVEKKQAGGK